MAKDENIILQKNREILKLKSNIKDLQQNKHQSNPSHTSQNIKNSQLP